MRVALALLVMFGCAADDAVQGGDHDNGKADGAGGSIHSNSPYFWAVTDYDVFKSVAQAPPFRVGQPLAETDKLTIRLQTWADQVHASIADDVLRTTGKPLAAPKPIIKIVPAKSANAWVSGIPICLTGEADLSGIGAARPARTTKLMFLEHERVREALSLFGAPRPKCVDATNWPSLPDAIKFYNASGTKCRVEQTGTTYKVSGAGCGIDASGPTSATQLTFYVTSPYIHFTTAFLALANDESNVVGTLMHELGHYYRSHVVSDLVMGRYNFWYAQKDPPPLTPIPASDSKELENRFREVLEYPRPQIAGQRISYRLTRAVLGIGGLLSQANATTPSFACADAVARWQGEWKQEFGGLGASFVLQATADKYLAFEASLLSCAGSVPVTVAGGAGALALSAVQSVIATEAHKFASPIVEGGTLAQMLDTLNERAAVADRAAADFRATLVSRRLGNYTAEQEADDLLLRYYSGVGRDPEAFIDVYLDLVKQHPVLSDPGVFAGRNDGMSLAACEALYAADWMVDNELVYVSLGSIHDVHHGDCYRWFNLSQQQRARGYQATGTPPMFEDSWTALQAVAQAVTDAFFDGGGGAMAIDPGVDPYGRGTIFD